MLLRIFCITAALLLAGCQSGPVARADLSASAPPGALYATGSEDPRYAGIVVDADSGSILYDHDAGSLRYPASLTKMMTLYLLLEAVEGGRVGMDTLLLVSAEAAAQPASKLGVRAGSTISVADAIGALAVKSANDVAVVVAENLAGSEAAFASRMTRTARGLGMRDTVFRNASGLPDPAQVTTARDMAALVRALHSRFPRQYSRLSAPEFHYAGQTYGNTNKLLEQVAGMEFGKTGYTRAAGYNLATSVRRGGRRVIVVVLGAPSGAARNAQVTGLVDSYLPERSSWLFGG